MKYVPIHIAKWNYNYPWHTIKTEDMRKIPTFVREFMAIDGITLNVGSKRIHKRFDIAVAARFRYGVRNRFIRS